MRLEVKLLSTCYTWKISLIYCLWYCYLCSALNIHHILSHTPKGLVTSSVGYHGNKSVSEVPSMSVQSTRTDLRTWVVYTILQKCTRNCCACVNSRNWEKLQDPLLASASIYTHCMAYFANVFYRYITTVNCLCKLQNHLLLVPSKARIS